MSSKLPIQPKVEAPFFPLDEAVLDSLAAKASNGNYKKTELLLAYLSSNYSHDFLTKNTRLGPRIIKVIDIGVKNKRLHQESVKNAVVALRNTCALLNSSVPKDVKVTDKDGNIVYFNRSLLMTFLPHFLAKETEKEGITEVSKNVISIVESLLSGTGFAEDQDLPALFETIAFLKHYQGPAEFLNKLIEKLQSLAPLMETDKEFEEFFTLLLNHSNLIEIEIVRELRQKALITYLKAYRFEFTFSLKSTQFRIWQQKMTFPSVPETCKAILMEHLNGLIVHGADLSSFTQSFALDKHFRRRIKEIEFKGVTALCDFLKSYNLKETFSNLHTIKGAVPFSELLKLNRLEKREGISHHISIDSQSKNFVLQSDDEALVFAALFSREDIVLVCESSTTFKFTKDVDKKLFEESPGFKNYDVDWKSGSEFVLRPKKTAIVK